MNTLAIAGVFVGSLVLTVASFKAHGRLAGPEGKPGLVSMLAFAFGWLCVLCALITGLFLLSRR